MALFSSRLMDKNICLHPEKNILSISMFNNAINTV